MDNIDCIGSVKVIKKRDVTWYNGWRCHEVVDTCSSGAVSDQGDPFGVAAELGDVFLNPVKSSHLIHQSEIGQASFSFWPASNVQKALTKK